MGLMAISPKFGDFQQSLQSSRRSWRGLQWGDASDAAGGRSVEIEVAGGVE